MVCQGRIDADFVVNGVDSFSRPDNLRPSTLVIPIRNENQPPSGVNALGGDGEAASKINDLTAVFDIAAGI
jgi:hypothetical protein